jgi:2-isopropylmalate synthase/UPF0716 protein FxsA
MLMIPGFFTDILGILLQFNVLTSMFVNRYYVKSRSCNTDYDYKKNRKDDDVIDVEIINNNTTTR